MKEKIPRVFQRKCRAEPYKNPPPHTGSNRTEAVEEEYSQEGGVPTASGEAQSQVGGRRYGGKTWTLGLVGCWEGGSSKVL